MKKVFSIVAFAAALAFGFTSCKEKPQPEPEPAADFKITVDNITTTNAKVSVEPFDATASYSIRVFLAEDIKSLSNDDLGAAFKQSIDKEITNAKAEGKSLTYSDYIFAGNKDMDFGDDLLPRTEFCVVAMKMDDKGSYDAKSIVKKNFKTLEIQAKATQNLDFHAARLLDGTATDKAFFIDAAPADSTSEVFLFILAQDVVGHFSYIDCVLKLSGFIAGQGKAYGFLDLDFTGTASGSKITYDGWFIAQNEIKYNFSFECERAANAPAKLRSLEPAKEMSSFEMPKSFGYICK